MSYQGFYNTIDQFAYYQTGFNESVDHVFIRLKSVKDGAYTQSQARGIREVEARYAEMTNAYQICDILYESWLDVYNFLKIQTSDTIYANAYNVHTGESVETADVTLFNSDQWFAPFVKRFGTPATSMNYFLLAGVFNDEAMGLESGHLALVNFDVHIALFSPFSAINPDTYADNGFNIWGYDSLRYAISNNMPITMETYPLFGNSGYNMNRENWRVFAMRKMNQFMSEGVERLTPDDAFPTFYDDVLAVTIEN